MKSIDTEIKNKIDQARQILVVSHVRPDGDAIGSMLGLGLALIKAGKSVEMVLTDGVPASFHHLPGHELILKSPTTEADLFITVDCADFKRTGKQFEKYRKPDINIDHHVTNENFGQINLIEPQSVATSSVLTDHLPEWGLTIDVEVASNLATGIVTDTLGFRTSNTNSAALRQAALLIDTGIDLPNLYNRALVSRTLQAAKYWGAGLSSLKTMDGIVFATLKLEDRKASGYGGSDDADLINIISAIDDHTVGMIFVEQHNSVKISWRALQPGIDVSRIATYFNGGGHKAAAGADISGTLDEVQTLVLDKTREMLKL
jgi:phosphoesterase RecJ-like protein